MGTVTYSLVVVTPNPGEPFSTLSKLCRGYNIISKILSEVIPADFFLKSTTGLFGKTSLIFIGNHRYSFFLTHNPFFWIFNSP